jgi:hypothetical protein
MLDEVPQASQYIIEVSSPDNWTEVTSDLAHPSGIAWYLLQHHTPQVLQAFDFAPLVEPGTSTMDTTYRDDTWVFTGRTLWSQINEILKTQINTGCDSQGALYLRHDPLQMDSTDRDAIDDRMTWGPGDIREDLEYSRLIRMSVGLIDAYAFSWDGSTTAAYRSQATGTQAQGKTISVVNGLTVPSATSQTRLNEISGHLFAKANSPTPRFTLKAMRNFDTADPARMVWHTENVDSSYDPRGIGYASQRMLPEKVKRRWEKTSDGVWLKRIDIVMQPETSGQLGLSKQIPVAQETDFGLFDDFFDPFEWGTIITDLAPITFTEPTVGLQQIAAMNDDGYLYRTTDFNTPEAEGGPTWDRVNLSMFGTPQQFVVDAFSPGYLGTGTTINAWVATDSTMYLVEDLFAVAPTVTLQHTFRSAVEARRNVDFSFGVQDWGVVSSYYDADGVWTTYTTDGGTTWAAETQITNGRDTNGFYYYTPGLYVSSKTPGLAYTFAFTNVAADSALTSAFYRSTDYGASWALYTGLNTSTRNALGWDLHFPWNNNDDEQVCYYSSLDWTVTENPIIRTTGASYSNIAPARGGPPFPEVGPAMGRFSVSSNTQDDNYLLMMCHNSPTGIAAPDRMFNTFGYTSTDRGATWTEFLVGITDYRRGSIASDDKNTIYLWGIDGKIAYSNNFGASIDDRIGNILSLGVPGEHIGIAGGTS